jgi:hypothetical protein
MGTSVDFEKENTLEGSADPERSRPFISPERHDVSDDISEDVKLPPAPDGGLHAWLKVLGGFLIYINIWCVILTSIASLEC